jgi:hypothetical protein
MKSSLARSILRCGASLAFLCLACGGRSELPAGRLATGGSSGNGTGGMPTVSCSSDLECGESDACATRRCVDGLCTSEVTACDDGDACTEDKCDVLFGCAHRELTLDADGDGFKAPRPGFAPGDRDACGLDCNDLSAAAFPGNVELCDGVDNDCNGVVDDGMTYVASKAAPIRVSSRMNVRASRGDLIATSDSFVLTYANFVANGRDPIPHSKIKGLSFDGKTLFESDVSDLNVPTNPGSLAWSGEELANVWDDDRQAGNYEVFLGLFSAQGQKLAPDQRVSNALGFSKNPSVEWNRSEFVLAWDDRGREGRVPGDRAAILGQRAAPDGTLLGEDLALVDDGAVNENAALALSPDRIGLVYTIGQAMGVGTVRLGFRVLNAALALVGATPDPLGSDVQSPSVHFVGDRFVVLWELYPGGPGDALWGAAFDQEGQLVLPPRPVTSGARFARTHDAVSLGDRLLLAWSDDHAGNYDIYWEILGPDLSVLEPRQRLTANQTDSLSPAVAIGPGGKIGVLFLDETEGSRQAYFTTLECGPPR